MTKEVSNPTTIVSIRIIASMVISCEVLSGIKVYFCIDNIGLIKYRIVLLMISTTLATKVITTVDPIKFATKSLYVQDFILRIKNRKRPKIRIKYFP